MRRDDEYVSKRVRRMQMGKRKRGRPKIRWKDWVKKDMRERERKPRTETSGGGKSAPATAVGWD